MNEIIQPRMGYRLILFSLFFLYACNCKKQKEQPQCNLEENQLKQPASALGNHDEYKAYRNLLHNTLRDSSLFFTLLTSIKKQHPEELETILNQPCSNGETILINAISDITFIPNDPDSPTKVANQRLDVVKELIRLGANPTKGEMEKALEKALKHNDTDLFLYLLTLKNLPDVSWILHQALGYERIDFFKLLAERFGQVSISKQLSVTNEKGNNALHEAALRNNQHAIKTLLPLLSILQPEEKSAILNAYNGEGKTPLHLAIEQKAFQNVKALCEVGADLTLPDGEGITPLDKARAYAENTDKENTSTKAIYVLLGRKLT